MLHFSQQITQSLGVTAMHTSGVGGMRGFMGVGHDKRGFCQNKVYVFDPSLPQAGMPGRNTLPCQGHGNVIINKQLPTETPGIVDVILPTGVALSGAVTPPDPNGRRTPNG